MTAAAINALDDKASTVRKNAASLIVRLIQTHPWARIHGGTLKIEIFHTEYDKLKAQLDEIEKKVQGVLKANEKADDAEGEG